MKTFLRLPLSLAAAALLGIGCGGADVDTQPEVELSEEQKISAELERLTGTSAKQWENVRKALGRYKDVNVALAEGYTAISACEADATGAGMGIHFINFGLVQDLVSDPYKPEMLLYFPDVNEPTGHRLASVEYFQVAVGQPTPSILGQQFNGPMEGHGPGQPVHFDLHVWLYKFNPNGLFNQYNPQAKCP